MREEIQLNQGIALFHNSATCSEWNSRSLVKVTVTIVMSESEGIRKKARSDSSVVVGERLVMFERKMMAGKS